MTLTAKQLHQILHYNPETGVFRWKQCRGGSVVGSVAGGVNDKGYIRINIDGRSYRASRLAWLYVMGEWPAHLVDHRDHDRSNNRWENLRVATNEENLHNMQMRSSNTSGIIGVVRLRDRWQAQIRAEGRRIYLGLFKTKEEAAEVYAAAARRYHGEFAYIETEGEGVIDF